MHQSPQGCPCRGFANCSQRGNEQVSISFGVTWTDERPIRRAVQVVVAAYLALVIALLGSGFARDLSASAAAPVPVIARGARGQLAAAQQAVREAGGRVDMPLAIINGFRATVPALYLPALLASRAIVS